MATDYTALITSQHRDKPRFLASVALVANAIASVSDVLRAFPGQFSLDLAVGTQLDVVGKWVGLSRSVRIPVTDPYFAWDTSGRGWDEGYWKPPYAPVEGVVEMDDTTYRAALRLKVITNHWKGRQEAFTGIPVVLEHETDANVIFAVDNQNMSITFYVVGPAISPVLLAVIRQEGVLPKPMGVRIASIVYTPFPLLGLDANSHTVAGLDTGAFLF